MSSRPPEGLRLLGLGAALFGCVMMYVTSAVDSSAAGGAAALLGLLALVAAEALWNGRPWAFRASALLAGAYFAALLISPVFIPNAPPFVRIVGVLSAGWLVAALFYIRRQVASLAQPSSPTRVAVPGSAP